MKAFTRTIYGGPEVLHLKEVEKPTVKEGHILVRVFANSVNPADWRILRGQPFFARFVFGLFKPTQQIPGADFAGVVTEVGQNVSRFSVGDRVFGETLAGGAFAEYLCVPETICALMPEGSSFTQMAAVSLAGLTALQALVTHGKLQQGETVLINGASGGVGHFAVQIAKTYDARVTAVCSARNVDFVKGLGADAVIAYDKENIHQHTGQYHLVVDTNGNLSYGDYRRMGQREVTVGFTSMAHMAALSLKKAMGKFPIIQFTASTNAADLQTLAALVQSGRINVHLDKTYRSEALPDAIRYIEAMRTKGKVAITWE